MANQTFEFKPGSLKRNLKAFDGDINRLVAGVIDYSGDKAVAYMKTNAPWKDQTGNARATLAAYGVHTDTYHEIHLHGGMPYQIFLEVRWAGRFAIIGPAVKYQGLAVMNRLKGLITKLGRI
jgi:hypothetical protein